MGFKDWQIPDVMPASYDTKARVQFMDDHGFKAQIMYPNVLGFAGQAAARLDPELRLVSTQIYNDAMAEMQADSGNRLFPMALIPWWDVKLAVAEVERCHKMGFRGINTNTDPHDHGLPELGDTYWDPLWEVCTGYNLPINFHIGASDESMTWFGTGSLPSFDLARKVAYGSTMLFLSNARVLVNIMLSRFLERWPDLKMVSVESGVGWIPFILEAISYQMSEAGIKPKLSPKEIFQRQMYASSWFEREDLIHNARLVGVDNVMFETDFPHPTCLYPNPLGYMAETAAKFTLEERQKIFGGNAARVYNIPV
jgi:predicted TIM-barrel fold metal-dependent hydrolase